MPYDIVLVQPEFKLPNAENRVVRRGISANRTREGGTKLNSARNAGLPNYLIRIDNFEKRRVIFRCRKHCPACQKKQCDFTDDEHCDTFCPECASLVGKMAVMIYLTCSICGRDGHMPVRGKVIPDINQDKVVCYFCNPTGGGLGGLILTLPESPTTFGLPIWEETLSTTS